MKYAVQITMTKKSWSVNQLVKVNREFEHDYIHGKTDKPKVRWIRYDRRWANLNLLQAIRDGLSGRITKVTEV